MSKGHILVVEDNMDNYELVRFILERAGYDVFLVLEATIGFNKRDEAEDEEALESASERRTFEPAGKVKFTTQDHRFLKALKIAVDEELR